MEEVLRPAPPLHLGALELAAAAHGPRHEALFHRGHPPSLYNDIVGDAFAPRNPYCLRVDTCASRLCSGLGHALRQDLAARPARAEGGKAGDDTRHPRHA
ncbi:MAG: hypothetical protein ACLUEK_10055 [Oscillospiraceae bacterium]